MTALIHGDAQRIPLADGSVQLIVSSPPYFALRSYRDGNEHYDGQLGSEPTPADFLINLWTVMDECWRVLADDGSCWINLGDKWSGSGGHNNAGISSKSTLQGNGHVGGGPKIKATRRSAPDRYNQASDVRAKGLLGLPWRFALGLTCPDPYRTCYQPGDHPQWILRSEVIQSKKNGLPESVTDRPRRSHEQWFQLTKQGSYFAGIDEIREAHAPKTLTHRGGGEAHGNGQNPNNNFGSDKPREPDARGKLPGSVWEVPSEPLRTPEFFVSDDAIAWRAFGDPPNNERDRMVLRERLWRLAERRFEEGCSLHVKSVDHFAAFPSALPYRIIAGWSPKGICTVCGEARRPMVAKEYTTVGNLYSNARGKTHRSAENGGKGSTEAAIIGYACSCPDDSAPTRPAVILDPFSGTGTVPMMARAMGRCGIGLDLSWDYLHLAQWRVFKSGDAQKCLAKTGEVAAPKAKKGPKATPGMVPMFEDL